MIHTDIITSANAMQGPFGTTWVTAQVELHMFCVRRYPVVLQSYTQCFIQGFFAGSVFDWKVSLKLA